MTRDSRYDILFEPVQIGPVVAKNRFYSVPHASGMGDYYPQANAAFRGTKAEGGWGTVCVEETEIHPSTDILPYIMPGFILAIYQNFRGDQTLHIQGLYVVQRGCCSDQQCSLAMQDDRGKRIRQARRPCLRGFTAGYPVEIQWLQF